MRIGQTAAIVFISKLLGSVLGFFATLTFARLLGAEIIGHYSVILAVVAWLKLGSDLGVSHAVSKRISEADEPNQYYTAGIIIIAAFAAVISLLVVLLRGYINSYVGADVWMYVIPLVCVGLLISFNIETLNGERKVHIAGLLNPVNLTITSVTQIALVLAGFSLTGMIFGYLVGEVLIVLAALTLVSSSIRRPSQEHFRQLYDFAKYSWLGSLKLRSFNDIDVLGALVSPNLVGIYTVAWSLSKYLTIFDAAIRKTIFPDRLMLSGQGLKNIADWAPRHA